MDNSDCIKEGDNLILKKENNLKLFKLWKKRRVFMDKKNFLLDAAIGQPYGTVWEVRNNDAVKIQQDILQAEQLGLEEKGGDNRNIVDDSSTQKLSREDISSLKQSGHSGESIVEHLVENSATFKEKTVFSQAKYRKRKRDKHLTRFQILRPSTRLLCEMYWNRAPSKVIQLRADTLAQILTAANIQSNTKVMVVETTQGLLLGAIMERMAGCGSVVQFHSEDTPVRLAVDAYNFPKSHQDIVHTMLLGQVGNLLKDICHSEKTQESDNKSKAQGSGDKTVKDGEASSSKQTEDQSIAGIAGDASLKSEDRTKKEQNETQATTVEGSCAMDESDSAKSDVNPEKEVAMETTSVKGDAKEERFSKGKRKIETPEEKAAKLERQQRRQDAYNSVKQILQPRDMDALVIVSKFQPSPILMALLEFLCASRPFVVYCSNKEPLMECYLKLRDRGGALNLRLTETWLRNYQVLPERTHPLVTMSGTGGYLLTGINVEVPPSLPET